MNNEDSKITRESIGELIADNISPVLIQIEESLWIYQAKINGKMNWSTDAFRAAVKIFMTIFMDKMYDAKKDEMSQVEMLDYVENAGNTFNAFIIEHTGINTRELYNDEFFKNKHDDHTINK